MPQPATAVKLDLGFPDYAILIIYFAFVVIIGALLRGKARTGEKFLTSGRSMPGWVAALAFLSANLGAQEMIGMGASGAKYGFLTTHFYWMGAAPAASSETYIEGYYNYVVYDWFQVLADPGGRHADVHWILSVHLAFRF